MKQRTLAIVHGSGATPAQATRAAKAAGHRVVAIAISETNARPPKDADVRVRADLRQGGTILNALEDHGCDSVLLVGKFDKGLNHLDLSDIDQVTGAILARLPGRADMDIAAVVLEELESRGFHAVSQLEAFSANVASKGHLAGPVMDDARSNDVAIGLRAARAIADLDIGQTVVVKQGMVVAVEAAEHSDRCIRRAGRLVEGPLSVVKVARPNQDFRFDTPVVGTRTLRTMHRVGADLLAIEAGRCLIMDGDFNSVAEQVKISVVGV